MYANSEVKIFDQKLIRCAGHFIKKLYLQRNRAATSEFSEDL